MNDFIFVGGTMVLLTKVEMVEASMEAASEIVTTLF